MYILSDQICLTNEENFCIGLAPLGPVKGRGFERFFFSRGHIGGVGHTVISWVFSLADCRARKREGSGGRGTGDAKRIGAHINARADRRFPNFLFCHVNLPNCWSIFFLFS
jgi:hypothetical protein